MTGNFSYWQKSLKEFNNYHKRPGYDALKYSRQADKHMPKASLKSNIKERPILFNAHMVRAILGGQKTVTRRAIKLQPHIDASGNFCVGRSNYGQDIDGSPVTKHFVSNCCPFGKPGDQLWVRETFALLGNDDGVCIDWSDNLQKGDEKSAAKIYRASCSQGDYGLWEVPDTADWKPKTDGLLYEGDWRPSIHMPRWASRILLEITSIRIERLQDISSDQCRAEGYPGDRQMETGGSDMDAWLWYRGLWQEINGPETFGAQWVWVVEFKRLTL